MKKLRTFYDTIKRFSILASLLFGMICFNPLSIKAENPEWMYFLEGYAINASIEDGDNIWFSSNDYYYTKATYKFHKESKLIVDTLMFGGEFLDMDLEGNLWIAGRNGLARYDGNNITIWDDSKLEDISIQNGSILSMNIDNEDNIWIGTMKYGIVKFDGSQFTNYNSQNSGLPQSVTAATAGIKSIDFDKSHNVWISCTENGIVKFDGNDWTVYNKDNSELPTNSVNELKVDKTGNIWVCTNLGLAKYDNQNWTIFNKENTGFPSDKFSKISIDNSNNIWVNFGKDFGVDYGIIKFDGVDYTIYNKSNSGLKSNTILAILIDSYDNKWLSVIDNLGYNGVNVFKEDGVILTSVEEADNNLTEFVVSPNPANEFIELNIGNKGLKPFVESVQIQIFDMLGIDVSPARGGVNGVDGGGFRIDVSTMPSGVYYIRIGNKVEKFLKM